MTDDPDRLPSRSEARARVRHGQQDYVNGLIEASGLSLRGVALKAGVSPTTLSRFMNEADYVGLLSTDTLARLGDTFGVYYEAPASAAGDALQPALPTSIVDGIAQAGPALETMACPDNSMSGKGMLKGDVVVIDTDREAAMGDIVAAQIRRPGRPPETIVRLFVLPHLVACPLETPSIEDRRPLLVDQVTAKIVGVIVGCFRWAA